MPTKPAAGEREIVCSFLELQNRSQQLEREQSPQALRLQLPELFPEHGFEFVPQEELTEVQPPARDELLFRVLATEVHNEDEELIAECAGPELVGEIQAAVDKIVAAAKRRNTN